MLRNELEMDAARPPKRTNMLFEKLVIFLAVPTTCVGNVRYRREMAINIEHNETFALSRILWTMQEPVYLDFS